MGLFSVGQIFTSPCQKKRGPYVYQQKSRLKNLFCLFAGELQNWTTNSIRCRGKCLIEKWPTTSASSIRRFFTKYDLFYILQDVEATQCDTFEYNSSRNRVSFASNSSDEYRSINFDVERRYLIIYSLQIFKYKRVGSDILPQGYSTFSLSS